MLQFLWDTLYSTYDSKNCSTAISLARKSMLLFAKLHAGFLHFFIYIFPGFLQGFSRSNLRFSRTKICRKKCCHNLYDLLSLQEKYSIIVSFVFFKNFQDFSRTFSYFLFFSGLSQAWKFIFHFPGFQGFQGFPGAWEPCHAYSVSFCNIYKYSTSINEIHVTSTHGTISKSFRHFRMNENLSRHTRSKSQG